MDLNKIYTIKRHLSTCISQSYADFLDNILNDHRVYAEQLSIYGNVQHNNAQNAFGMRLNCAPSGWPLPRSIWKQKIDQLRCTHKIVRYLELIRNYAEQQQHFFKYQNDSLAGKFYFYIRQGNFQQLKQYQQQSIVYSMLQGYLQLIDMEETQLQDFSQWIYYVKNYVADGSNDILLRAVFSLLSGDEKLLREFLQQQKILNKYDEIWLTCVQAVVLLFSGQPVNLQAAFDKVVYLLNGTGAYQDRNVAAMCQDFNGFLSMLLYQHNQNQQQNPIDFYKQKVILYQAIYVVANIDVNSLIQVTKKLIYQIQKNIISIYAKYLVQQLQEYQKLLRQQQEITNKQQDLELDDLADNTMQKNVEQQQEIKNFLANNIKDRIQDLEILPIINLTLNYSDVSQIFVMFSQTILINKYFINILEESINDQRDSISCKLNIIRYKLQYNQLISRPIDYNTQTYLPNHSHLENDEEERRLIQNTTGYFYLEELYPLLYEGNHLISEQIRNSIINYVLRKILRQVIETKFLEVYQLCFNLHNMMPQLFYNNDFNTQQYMEVDQCLFEELEIYKHTIQLILLLKNLFVDSEQTVAVEHIIDEIRRLLELIQAQLHYEQTNDPNQIRQSLEEIKHKQKYAIELELLINLQAKNRYNEMQELYQHLYILIAKYQYQVYYWMGMKRDDTFNNIDHNLQKIRQEIEGVQLNPQQRFSYMNSDEIIRMRNVIQ